MGWDSMTSDDLAAVLSNLGVDVRRADGKEISGRCPVHAKVTGREDRSPSWSMSVSTGLWICFSCGARGNLPMLVSQLTGDQDSLMAVHRIIIESSLSRIGAPAPLKEYVPVDWVAFGKFQKVPEKMLRMKHLDTDAAWRYGIRWDTENKCWIIPIVSQFGELRGWQSKKTGWVRNFPEGVKKSETLFGIDKFSSRTAVLVESPLDVVRFSAVFDRPQCLASFGATVSDEQIRLLSNSVDCLIVAMDNDDAGIASSKRLSKILPNFRKGIRWFNYGGSSAKDIGDMTDDEIEVGTLTATVMPPWIGTT